MSTIHQQLSDQDRVSLVPELVAATKAAELTGVSRSSWWALHSSGRCPMPVRLGRRVLWRVEELRAWVRAGCPSRAKWEVLRKAGAA